MTEKRVKDQILRFAGMLQAPESFSKVSRCLHTAEVAGSSPASPTRQKTAFAGKTCEYGLYAENSTECCAATWRRSAQADHIVKLPYANRHSLGVAFGPPAPSGASVSPARRENERPSLSANGNRSDIYSVLAGQLRRYHPKEGS